MSEMEVGFCIGREEAEIFPRVNGEKYHLDIFCSVGNKNGSE